MNTGSRELRIRLLRRYYKSADIEWMRPKNLHWIKIVDTSENWRWIQPDQSARNRICYFSPLHVYQTVLRFKTENPPCGHKTSGYLLGGPLFFDVDVIEPNTPISIWKIGECASLINELEDILKDKGFGKIIRASFSGFRGVHVFVQHNNDSSELVSLEINEKSHDWKNFGLERRYIARSVGNLQPMWDWRVSTDLWRVARVPRSIHGRSALQATNFSSPYTTKRIIQQMTNATPFSLSKEIRVRITHSTPLFTFVDRESYGPFRKDWVTRLPIAVALHLNWLGFAKFRELGPRNIGDWFEHGWQMLFRYTGSRHDMDLKPTWGVVK